MELASGAAVQLDDLPIYRLASNLRQDGADFAQSVREEIVNFLLNGKLMTYKKALSLLLKGQSRTPDNISQAAKYLHWKCKVP